MYEEIYLETDEEVTSAIEKIKKSKKRNIALCLPRNSQLGQSIVNLKLIYKEASAEGKEIGMVSPDASIRNLAQRVGFNVFPAVKEINFPKTKDIDDVKPKKEVKKTDEKKDKKKEEEEQEETADETEKNEEDSDPDLQTAGFTSQPLYPEESVEAALDEGNTDHSSDKEAQENSKDDIGNEEPTPREDQPAKEERKGASAHGNMIPTRGNLRFFRQKKRRSILIPLFVILGLLLAGGVSAALFIPTASVKVTLSAQPFTETVKSSVDVESTAVNADTAVIPGKAVTLEQVTKSSAKATGKKDLGEKATGTVTMTNEWSSSVQTFTAGTKIRAGNGNEFALLNDVSIPGASSSVVAGKSVITPGKKEAQVQAVQPGENYNNAPTTFTIPSLPKAQQEKIYASSSVAFTGGTSRVVTVVTQSDIDKLLESAKALNIDEGLKKLKEQAGESVLLDKAVQTISQEASVSAVVDNEAESLEGTVKGNFRVIVFSKSDQEQLLEKLLANKIPQGQRLAKEGDGIAMDLSQYDINLVTDKRLELTNNLKAFTVTQFDENAVRRSLIGSLPADVKALVDKQVSTEKVEYTVNPTWIPRMPLNGSKIKVEYTYKSKEETPVTQEEKKEE